MACTPPVVEKRVCSASTRPGTLASTSRSSGAAGVKGASRAQSSSIVVEPQRPHDDVVVVSRGAVVSEPARLDAHHVELGVDGRPGAAVAHDLHRRTGEEPLGVEEPDRELELVAGCPHRGADEVVVEPDLEWLLDDQLVGHAAAPVVVVLHDEHRASASPGHDRRLRPSALERGAPLGEREVLEALDLHVRGPEVVP